jgi:hypothetical protein
MHATPDCRAPVVVRSLSDGDAMGSTKVEVKSPGGIVGTMDNPVARVKKLGLDHTSDGYD